MAAGPASRLGSTEPREKTGLRLSPQLASDYSSDFLRSTVRVRYCRNALNVYTVHLKRSIKLSAFPVTKSG